MIRTLLAGAAAFVLAASPATAAVQTLSFRIDPTQGVPFQHFGDLGGYPFGLTATSVIDGSVTVDSADAVAGKVSYDKFLSLDYTSGTKTWTLADLGGNSFMGFDLNTGEILGGLLWFDNENFVSTGGGMALFDGRYGIYCNGCVSIPGRDGGGIGGVPEPAAWALMLLGFAGAGAMVRRQAPGRLRRVATSG